MHGQQNIKIRSDADIVPSDTAPLSLCAHNSVSTEMLYCAVYYHPWYISANDSEQTLAQYQGLTLYTGWHKKNGNFWKPQQKLKKSKKKNLLTEIEPLQLAF